MHLSADVATQSNSPGWTLGKWAEYYNKEPSARDKVRNVISLEISGTLLADRVLPPRLVRELDWVDKFWPSTRRGKGHAYPKVQLYCLMGVASAWTVGYSPVSRITRAEFRLGLARRLCWLVSVLSHPQGMQGRHPPLKSWCHLPDFQDKGILLHSSHSCKFGCVRAMVRDRTTIEYMAR